MTDRVERLLGSQRAFVADASHQLRTPLTGLRLRIEEARAAGVSPPPRRELDAGVAEVDRLAQIVEELLVLSRAGERELPGERLELRRTRSSGRSRAGGRPPPSASIALERGGAARRQRCGAPSADADRALDVLSRTRCATRPRGSRVTLASAPGRIEVRDRGPGLGGDGGRGDLRALPPRQRRARRPVRQRPRPGDRARAGARVGRRGHAAQPRRRRRRGDAHAAGAPADERLASTLRQRTALANA